jgi:two-component system, OmpR family, aerobic respiration control sensor histidine kinase ArcB
MQPFSVPFAVQAAAHPSGGHPVERMIPGKDYMVSASGLAAEAAEVTLLGHDLRAAVSDIIGGLRLIDHAGLDEGTQLQLERIRSAGEVLARLLEEGLAAMLGESEMSAGHPTNVQMSRFLYDVEMRWAGRAREKGLGFHVSVGSAVPPVVVIERIALERVLANLLSNAIKHTDKGGIDLDVEVAEDGALRFTVSDEGPGFSPAALERLFEYAGRPEGSQKPGHGLGMRISKDMTGRLGGRISVRNGADRGASVTLDLPQGRWLPAAPETEVPLPDLSRVKVLVAEDSPTNQAIIGHMLTKMGAEFEVAEDGVEALHWLEREDFDIALIDIEMPRLNGIDVIRSIRSNDRLHTHMPVVAVTAYVLRANREAIYAAGADAILAKPLAGLEKVGAAINQALTRRAALPEAGSPDIDALTCPELDRELFDHLIDIAGPEGRRELLDRLCNDLRRAERGLFAGLKGEDRTSIRSETHVLIALAGAVGAERLQKLAEHLNASAQHRDDPHRAGLGAEAMAQIDRLITFVAAERARMGETV